MSYNTRNNRGNYQAQGSPANRNTNFVHGGQYKPNDRPLIQMPNQQSKSLMQQQQSKPQQQQQQQQQFQQTPQYQTTTTNVTQQQTPIKSIMKTKQPETPAPQPAPALKSENNSSDEGNNGVESVNSEGKPRRPWNISAIKLSKKERRNRRNKRIGKLVRPKNAIMVLNELCGGASLKFDDIGTQNGLFGVAVSIDNNRYEAFASSKNGAKQKACENALKGYIASKIKAKQANTSAESMETDDSVVKEDEVGEDVSWCHIASFALYKLMDSWQDVSEIIQPDAIFQKIHQKPSSTPKPIKELPANAADIHPVMLLHQMRPGIVIEDVSSSGQTPHIIYTVKVNIDGDQIFGQGPNKKTARKNCAQAAMEKHFGVVYPPPPAAVAPPVSAQQQQPAAFPGA